MLKQFFLMMTVLFLSVFLFQSCATKIYTDAMKTGSELELQKLYIKAYDEYKKALDEKPNDKKAVAKMEELEKLIAENFVKQGNDLFQGGHYLDAKHAFDQALIYRKNHGPALHSLLKLDEASKAIKNKYAMAEQFEVENQWIQSRQLLQEIQSVYQDDSGLTSRISELENNGYQYFQKLGITRQKEAKYKESLGFLTTAQQLKDTDQIKQEIIVVNTYIKADDYYQSALDFSKADKIENSVDKLIEARQLVGDHKDVNLLFASLLNNWSGILLANGKRLMDTASFDKAYIILKKLYDQNPEFPEAEYYFKQARDTLLKIHYALMIDDLKTDNLEGVISSGNDIFKIQPGYLDSSEIMSQVIFKAFNKFYQRGLHFLKTGNYGRSILAFRSAEDQLGESLLLKNNIDLAKEKILNDSALRIAFWNFNFERGDAGIATLATSKLKEALEVEEKKSPFKNIKLQYNIITDREMALRAEQKTVDWGLVQARNCNALVSGRIVTLRIDTSKTFEWKTRIHEKKAFIDNPKYIAAINKKAELNHAYINKVPGIYIDYRYYKKSVYKDEIKKIEAILPGIAPKIEEYIAEEAPYQVEKHTMKAFVQVEVEILYQNGAPLWPSINYNDEFEIEDLVISPDLQSSIPEERNGDPLVLPSDYEFMEMAINHIINTKITPDLTANFNNYGMRFFNAANKLSPIENQGVKSSEALQSAIEDYYKFLFCYKDKGDTDDIPEKVTRYLDSFISNKWLLGKENSQTTSWNN